MSVLNKQFFFFVFALSMGLGAKAQELPPVLFTMDTMNYSTKFLGMSVPICDKWDESAFVALVLRKRDLEHSWFCYAIKDDNVELASPITGRTITVPRSALIITPEADTWAQKYRGAKQL